MFNQIGLPRCSMLSEAMLLATHVHSLPLKHLPDVFVSPASSAQHFLGHVQKVARWVNSFSGDRRTLDDEWKLSRRRKEACPITVA